jgi:hypothetical protein
VFLNKICEKNVKLQGNDGKTPDFYYTRKEWKIKIFSYQPLKKL